MTDFTRFHLITGKILGVGSCDHLIVYQQAQTDEEQIHPGERLDGSVWYLPNGVKTLRPTYPIELEHTIPADGVTAVQLSLLPGSQVESLLDGEMWPNESEFYFSTEQTGTFRYRIYMPFPYQTAVVVTIHAT